MSRGCARLNAASGKACIAARALLLGVVLAGGIFQAGSAWACSACYGQSDSAMAAGMNWGILSLLGMIVFMLGGVAGFFIFLARRSATVAARQNTAVASLTTPQTDANFKDADAWQMQTLAARGGLKKVSALAQQRNRCSHQHHEGGPVSVPPSRS